MENTANIGLSRQMVLRRQLDVIANNVANMNSHGYKRQRSVFQEFLVDSGDGGRPLSYVLDYGVARDASAGKLEQTGNRLDLAISGDGYFVVATDQGEMYTRNGRLHIDEEGRLVSSSGDPLLDVDGRELTITELDTEITITGDGTVNGRIGRIGQLNVVTFEKTGSLTAVAAGLLRTDLPPIPAENAKVVQGMLESSNVEPILEIIAMIEVQRNYQSTQRLLDTDNELQRKAIDRIGRPN